MLFPVNVSAELQQLQLLLNSFNLKKPAAKKFTHRLDEARKALVNEKQHKHNEKRFCDELAKFIKDARKETGKSLSAAEADQLLLLATQIAHEAGC